MIVEMARSPVNLDNLMNEGMAFAIDRFKDRKPNCPLGRPTVMTGRRKPTYNPIDKVMKRLDRVMKVLEAMGHIVVVNIQ